MIFDGQPITVTSQGVKMHYNVPGYEQRLVVAMMQLDRNGKAGTVRCVSEEDAARVVELSAAEPLGGEQ